MFGLSWPKQQPKPKITAATRWDEDGNVIAAAEFDPPLTNTWHALLELGERRRESTKAQPR